MVCHDRGHGHGDHFAAVAARRHQYAAPLRRADAHIAPSGSESQSSRKRHVSAGCPLQRLCAITLEPNLRVQDFEISTLGHNLWCVRRIGRFGDFKVVRDLQGYSLEGGHRLLDLSVTHVNTRIRNIKRQSEYTCMSRKGGSRRRSRPKCISDCVAFTIASHSKS